MSANAVQRAGRRQWLLGMAIGFAGVRRAHAQERPRGGTLPAPASLADALQVAQRKRQPLVVMVSLEGCPYCRMARENYLYPLYMREGLPVVQIDMRSAQPVRDFNQTDTTHDALVRGWGVRMAPTLLFFGAQGNEIAERLNGATIADFYGAYLDARLEAARRNMQ